MMATEIIEIDAPWAEKWTKTRVSFLSAPTVVCCNLSLVVVKTKCGMTVELFKGLLVTYGDPQLAQWPPPDGASVRHLATVPMPGEGTLGANCV